MMKSKLYCFLFVIAGMCIACEHEDDVEPNVKAKGKLTFNSQDYSLGHAYINSVSPWETDETGRIHSLYFTESKDSYEIGDHIKGKGIILRITLVGKSPFEITGVYSFMASSSDWPDPSDVRTVDDMTILYGPQVYKDMDDSSEESYENSTIVYEDEWTSFEATISKSGDEYTIALEGIGKNGEILNLTYTGNLEKVAH